MLKEIDLCQRIADMYPKNYYCWTHRKWAVEEWQAACRSADPAWALPVASDETWQAQSSLLLDADLRLLQAWAVQVSDYSGYHHRQVVLRLRTEQIAPDSPLLLAMASWDVSPQRGEVARVDAQPLSPEAGKGDSSFVDDALASLWGDEVVVCSALIARYPGKEALWSHLRACALGLLALGSLPQHATPACRQACRMALDKVRLVRALTLCIVGPVCAMGAAKNAAVLMADMCSGSRLHLSC